MKAGTLFFDIETRSATERWNWTPREFFRLGQYAWDDGEVVLTTDYDEMIEQIEKARMIVGHNIHAFDLSVLYGLKSTRPLELALEGRVFDTWTHATITYHAPYRFVMRNGRVVVDGAAPERAKMWYSLDNLCFQLKLPGKTESLQELAKKYNPPKTKVADLDYALIPTDDPDFMAYGVQDVVATRLVAKRLLSFPVNWGYAWREQNFAAINAQMSRNGFTVHTQRASDRVEELANRRAEVMKWLEEKFDFPTKGKMPWRSSEGKQAILNALATFGISPRASKDWPKSEKTNEPGLGGKVLLEHTAGTDAEDLGIALAELQGQRSLAQLALDSQWPDGKAHPEVTTLQRSGRSSLTNPGLTIWTARGPGAIEKSYFIASEGRKLLEFDYSQADARIVAAYSGDPEYAKRLLPGVDAHELTGRIVFGDEVYDSDPARYRQTAKGLGHAYAYRAGPRKLAETAKQPLEVAQKFVNAMDAAYPWVTAWQNRVTQEGDTGWVTNDWGRRMPVDADRSYNQSPALYGQSGTREIMVDGLIRIAKDRLEVITWLVATIHDAVAFDVPIPFLEEMAVYIPKMMETTFKPKSRIGQAVHFPMEAGKPADDWYAAGH